MILALDTSAAHCAVALLSGDRIVAEAFEPMTKGQAERLLPICIDVLAQAGCDMKDLKALGVGIGPGNFTGIRIGVSAARGLALARGIPAIGVSALEAQAYGISGLRVSTLDARQEKLYVQTFTDGASGEIALCDMQTLPRLSSQARPTVVGHRGDEIAAHYGGTTADAAENPARAIALIAASRSEQVSERPAPLYIRAPNAAPPRDKPPVILDA